MLVLQDCVRHSRAHTAALQEDPGTVQCPVQCRRTMGDWLMQRQVLCCGHTNGSRVLHISLFQVQNSSDISFLGSILSLCLPSYLVRCWLQEGRGGVGSTVRIDRLHLLHLLADLHNTGVSSLPPSPLWGSQEGGSCVPATGLPAHAAAVPMGDMFRVLGSVILTPATHCPDTRRGATVTVAGRGPDVAPHPTQGSYHHMITISHYPHHFLDDHRTLN